MLSQTELELHPGGMQLAPVGVHWDVVKVGRHIAVRAIERIETPGAVAVDPAPAEPVLYFFVPLGSAAVWNVPETTALGLKTHLVLPSAGKEPPPGPYWLIGQAQGLTPAAVLRQALEAVR
ncbi:hypothetical protein [Streptomyces sp. NPDC001601]|uniref:hypothetical protein n=1 Tax=Streptomyces sp. NPDC001601 TaxID=3364592 RepID=UPI0036ADA64A